MVRSLSKDAVSATKDKYEVLKGSADCAGLRCAVLVCRRFKALQQHIDELTHEKYELIRGLAMQRKVQESLEAESERFADDFNRQVFHCPTLAVFLACIAALSHT